MRFIQVSGAKGGVGASTVASLIALQSAKDGHKTLLIDAGPLPSIEAIIAWGTERDGLTINRVNEGSFISASDMTNNYDVVIVDSGTEHKYNIGLAEFFGDSATYVQVLRNDYLSLRHYTQDRPKTYGRDGHADIFVCVVNEESVLTLSDVKLIVGKEVIPFHMNSAVSRTIDAGLFATRSMEESNRHIYGWVEEITSNATV